MNPEISRREFAKAAMVLAAGAMSPLAWNTGRGAEAESSATKNQRPRYRAVSWWLVWDDLTWPNPELMDKIRRRADVCVKNDVNCCMIFGAHFRWDFMPLWGRLHDELHFIADELHQRNIRLFDHHSSVLTHRPRNREEAENIWRRNRHHVPFYPSREEASQWRFNGSLLNDWRMLDVETAQPVYLPTYNAEQYCMNNPAFREAYAKYVQMMLAGTGVDGLMSDDGIYYGGWRACGCQFCRERFKREYDHELPPVSDTAFWGNRKSAAFRDWIEMRFKSAGDFLGVAKAALPPKFPLLSCCSSSDAFDLPSSGMSCQDFIRNCNHLMLEMTGSTPALSGEWDNRIASELLHLGIARDYQVPCLGLGYAFYPATAFFVWAVNKFLGADTWLSTLKGRLNAPPEELAQLADDPDLAGEGFRWEQAHADLFAGEVETDVAVLFSRTTRDFYGEVEGDYAADYQATCLALLRGGITCEVVTSVPQLGKWRVVVLSSVICLSDYDKAALEEFLHDGGTVIATGPAGNDDGRANPAATPWLEQFGVRVKVIEPARPGGFPPYDFPKTMPIAECRVTDGTAMRDGWFDVAVGRGRLLWRPERISETASAAAVVQKLKQRATAMVEVTGLPTTWQMRQYRDGNRWLIHALPRQVTTILTRDLKNQLTGERIIERLQFLPVTGLLIVRPAQTFQKVTLHSPDAVEARSGGIFTGRDWSVDARGIQRYFIIECVA